jgi:predicted RNA binding protein YcfA (HicA-like mRNA interferase family)
MSAIPGTGRQGLRRKLSPEMRKIIADAEAQGWRLEHTGGMHLRLRHSSGRAAVFACTPSDWRAAANARALMRRKLREVAA